MQEKLFRMLEAFEKISLKAWKRCQKNFKITTNTVRKLKKFEKYN